MKKIISGKVYDTETAKKLGVYEQGEAGSAFEISEVLYRKKTGEYFLEGWGGPKTRYAEPADSDGWWKSGSRIIPMTYTEAQAWAEEHLDGDKYEAIFGEVAEDDSRMQVCYSLAAATVETIKRRASELGITAGAYIERLVKIEEKPEEK